MTDGIRNVAIPVRIESNVLTSLQKQALDRGMPLGSYVGYLLTAMEIGATLNDGTPKSAGERVNWSRLHAHFGVPLGQELRTL